MLEATQMSYSEIGAALSIIGRLWQSLTSGGIKLPIIRNSWTKKFPYRLFMIPTILTTWNNFLRQPVDIIASILLSILLVGMFIAESTANVLSAKIVSDTTAQVSSPGCSLAKRVVYSEFQPNAFDYSQRCYRKRQGTSGCTFYYNQSIAYAETNDEAPFINDLRMNAEDSALKFDTGLVEAKTIGINSANDFQFRRTASCTPLKAKSEVLELKLEDNGAWTFGYGSRGAKTVHLNGNGIISWSVHILEPLTNCLKL